MEEFVEYIAKALVDHPEDVEVQTVDGEDMAVIELRVHEEDLGQIIGKHGRTVKSVRALLSAAAAKSDCRVELEIVE